MDHIEMFIDLIEKAKKIVQDLLLKNYEPEYTQRYKRIISELKDISDAAVDGTLYQKFFNLDIVKMLDDHDPNELEKSILDINKHYCTYIRRI